MKQLLKQVDLDKSGFAKHEVFFQFLELHQIMLPTHAILYLKKHFSKNQTIDYKKALNLITIDLVAAGGKDLDATDSELKWTILPFCQL